MKGFHDGHGRSHFAGLDLGFFWYQTTSAIKFHRFRQILALAFRTNHDILRQCRQTKEGFAPESHGSCRRIQVLKLLQFGRGIASTQQGSTRFWNADAIVGHFDYVQSLSKQADLFRIKYENVEKKDQVLANVSKNKEFNQLLTHNCYNLRTVQMRRLRIECIVDEFLDDGRQIHNGLFGNQSGNAGVGQGLNNICITSRHICITCIGWRLVGRRWFSRSVAHFVDAKSYGDEDQKQGPLQTLYNKNKHCD